MTNSISRFSLALVIMVMLAGVLVAPLHFASAVESPTGGAGNPEVPSASTIDSADKVKSVIQNITNWMFTFFIAAAAIMIIYAAYTYLTSEGGENVSKAHKMLLYSAIAIVVATASRGLVTLVREFTEKAGQ